MLTSIDTGDRSRTLHSARYGQSYHSRHGALTESRYVYLDGSGVAARLQRGEPTRVLEIGFGLGLNFLLTADCALSADGALSAEHTRTADSILTGDPAPTGGGSGGGSGGSGSGDGCAQLHYDALEHDLPDRHTLASLDYGRWLNYPALADALLTDRGAGSSWSPPLPAGVHLSVQFADASDASAWQAHPGGYHAIYLDAFSPDVNPECWSAALLSRLSALLVPHGVLVSYCVQGAVRRRLATFGFAVGKRPGPPGKREVLRAIKL